MIELVTYSIRKLHPLFFLVSNCIKTALSLYHFVVTIIGLAVYQYGVGLILGIVYLYVLSSSRFIKPS